MMYQQWGANVDPGLNKEQMQEGMEALIEIAVAIWERMQTSPHLQQFFEAHGIFSPSDLLEPEDQIRSAIQLAEEKTVFSCGIGSPAKLTGGVQIGKLVVMLQWLNHSGPVGYGMAPHP